MRALITGVAGQDGSHMADLLLQKGYEVYGVVRRHSVPHFPNIKHLVERDAIRLIEADLADLRSIEMAVETAEPDEVYHLAAQSHVGTSFQQPEHTLNVTGLGTLRVLEACRRHAKQARIYQASSSEQYGQVMADANLEVIDKRTPFAPVSPYGDAKVLAHHLADTYRRAYGMHVSCGILFNHEGPRRGAMFVTRKITIGLARIKAGLQSSLQLGNLNAVRDWGYAPEYMEAAHSMLQQEKPGDHIVATGQGRTVRDFVEAAAKHAGLGQVWESVEAERRPTDIDRLVGDPGGAYVNLGWEPKTKFAELVRVMMDHDMRMVRNGQRGRMA